MKTNTILFTTLLAGSSLAYLAVAEPSTIAGAVLSVTDGDTIKLPNRKIRIAGIDAPESKQMCGSSTGPWPCGLAAKAKMQEMVRRDPNVTCTVQSQDKYGRDIATCSNSEGDLGRRLVAQGLAIAYRRYSTAYVDEERAAREQQLGIWCADCSFDEPEKWRQEHKPH